LTLTVSDGQASDTQSLNLVVLDQPGGNLLTIDKVRLLFNFVKIGKDSLSLSGHLPLPAGFSPAGKSVRVLIGGLDRTTTLTAKGKSSDKTFSLKFKPGATSAAFGYSLKNQDLFAKLQDLGFSKTQGNPSIDLPVIIVLDGSSHLAHATINYVVKSNKKGPVGGKGQK
jgi:hypothetical protein